MAKSREAAPRERALPPGVKLKSTLEGHAAQISALDWSPDGRLIASAAGDGSIRLWDLDSAAMLRAVEPDGGPIYGTVFHPKGYSLFSATDDAVEAWQIHSGRRLRHLRRERDGLALAIDKSGSTLAVGDDGAVDLLNTANGVLVRRLAGNGGAVRAIAFDRSSPTIATASAEGIALWNTTDGRRNAALESSDHATAVAFDNSGRFIAGGHEDRTVKIWELAGGKLRFVLEEHTATIDGVAPSPDGRFLASWSRSDGVRLWKTDGWELTCAFANVAAFSAFHPSSRLLATGGERTVSVWELDPDAFTAERARPSAKHATAKIAIAGGSAAARAALGSRLARGEASERRPTHGQQFWMLETLSHRRADGTECEAVLWDRAGQPDYRLARALFAEDADLTLEAAECSPEELRAEVVARIAWDEKPATISTATLRKIEDRVLAMKENPRRKKVIVSTADLRKQLRKAAEDWTFTDAEMMTALAHLENFGCVRVLRTCRGDERVLLSPELTNALASAMVNGMPSLEERRIFAEEHEYRDLLDGLSDDEKILLVDSSAELLLEHHVGFRSEGSLIFPAHVRSRRPAAQPGDKPVEISTAYTISGAVETIFPSLAILLGHTPAFTRTELWRGDVRFEGCGLKIDGERDGELDLVTYFDSDVARTLRALFQGLIEGFLAHRPKIRVLRWEPVTCSRGHVLHRSVVREESRAGRTSAFCPRCGEKIAVPKGDEAAQPAPAERRKLEEQQWYALRRSRLEVGLFRIFARIEREKLARPSCFIARAEDADRWVEKMLAADLEKSGVRVGGLDKCDRIVVVGTPKYSACEPIAAGKTRVVPVLLAGDEEAAFPQAFERRGLIDFRDERAYHETLLELIDRLYET